MSWVEWLDIVAPREVNRIHDLGGLTRGAVSLLDCGNTRSDIVQVRCCVSCYQYW